MNKKLGRKQFILHNKWFDKESVKITHSMTFLNEKGKITQNKASKVLEIKKI